MSKNNMDVVVKKEIDIATFGNHCVDIILDVPELPPSSPHQREAYMNELAKSPPHKKHWEAGGMCNTAIAAARLGLRCKTIGNVGEEVYGSFLLEVLRGEGIDTGGMSVHEAYETLLCWVLVDPLQQHDFLSRTDFCKEPAVSWMVELPAKIKTDIQQSKILFCDGYAFTDFTGGVLTSAVEYAAQVGIPILFDPGPRGANLANGTPEEREAFEKLITMSEVLLLTSEEAESLTSIRDPILAGQKLLRHGVCTKWVIVKLSSKGSILVTKSSISFAPGFKVDVVDTVGCGDSFAAAVAFGYIHNLPLVHTLTIANAVGAATATGSGAGRAVATLDKVIQLMRNPNLIDDEKFYDELFNQDFDGQDITLLTQVVLNGSSNELNYAHLQNVISEVLPLLESGLLKEYATV